jgi:hypothetical protein
MRLLMRSAVKTIPLAILVGLAGLAGCKDHRINEPATPSAPKVNVDVPGAHIGVEGQPESVAPHSRAIDVKVAPGDVKVNVDGEPLGERIRERREERQDASP